MKEGRPNKIKDVEAVKLRHKTIDSYENKIGVTVIISGLQRK